MKILLALAMVASAAPWVVSYRRVTKGNDSISIEAQDDGKVRLCLEVQCSILTPGEAREVSRILFVFTKPNTATSLDVNDNEKSFDELADESARDTDAYFCAKAKTEWERKAFCQHSKPGGPDDRP